MSRSIRPFKLGPTYGGINTTIAPHLLENGVSPLVDGFVCRFKGMEAAKGWEKLLSQQLTDGAATPAALKVLAIRQYFRRSSAVYLVVITNKRAYALSALSDLLMPITPGTKAYTTVDADSAAAGTTLNVASTTGYAVGDTILIGEGTAREESAVVDTITAGVSLNLLAALTYTHTAVQADSVRRTYAAAIVDVDSAAAQDVLSVSHTTQFTVGEAVIVGLGTAREEYAIIESISAGTSLTFTANLANAHTAAQADKVYRVAELSFTSEATEVDTENADDLFYFTDGVNPVQVWDATGAPSFHANLAGLTATDAGAWPDVEGIGTITTALKAKYIRSFEGFLVLGHTTEEGNVAPQRIRWARYGSTTSWANASDGTGQAGYFTFAGPDFIQRLQQLKRELLVYRESNVEGASYAGIPGAIFGFRRLATNVGLIGHEALADLRDAHMIVGQNNIHLIDGMSAPEVGDSVKTTFFDEMNPAYKDKCRVHFAENENEVWVISPTGSDDMGTQAYVYSLLLKKWVGKRPFDGSCFGYYDQQDTTTWDTVSGTWDEQDVVWDSRAFLAASPLNMMGDDLGYVYIVDRETDKDGVAWTRTYYTKLTDCGDSMSSKRVLHARIGLRREGSGTIAVSLGSTEAEGDELVWSNPESVSLAGGVNGYAYFDQCGKYHQLKIEATGLCNVREIELGFIPREDIN